MSILTTRKMTKRLGGLVAVGDLDLEIAERAIHSIIGPNGAGKTTVFNCVTGFYRPEEGEILFRGEPINGLDPDQIARLGVARTYQNIRLFGNMTVLENVLVGEHIHLKSSWLGAILNTRETRRLEAKAVEEGRR